MSAEMTSSSICVGTLTSRESSQILAHSRERLVEGANSFSLTTSSADVATRNGERGTTCGFASNVAAVADMDLVNAPNPWLPAYGFQLQQHAQHFQPTHEDLRANDPALAQQGDFLETILEETSDDLQSDSDRSGTTYWLGSDSETESVIHIKANQRAIEERPDGSGSECNSVVPKKRRRRNASKDRDATTLGLTDDHWTSPRSSRSSESSSRSSSLLQFESLERTCATVSPSGYSYDSLEYSNRSNSHFENTSPDSLDEENGNDDDDDDDEDEIDLRKNSRLNGFPLDTRNGFGNLRPYRSFESLDTCHKSETLACNDLSNGFSASFYSKTSHDLSAGALKNDRGRRDFWHGNEDEDDDDDDDEEEEEEEYEYDDEEEPEDEFVDPTVARDSDLYDSYENDDRVPGAAGSFADSKNAPCYSTTLDFRNAIDLREIGLEPRADAVYDLKSCQAASSLRGGGLGNSASSRLLQTTRLNIAGVEDACELATSALRCVKMASSAHSDALLHHRRLRHPNNNNNHDNHNDSLENKGGWSSDWSGFNFRLTNKSLSAPSLALDVDESTSCSYAFARSGTRTSGAAIGTVSSTSLFENYTRVASIPVDLNLCGRDEIFPNFDQQQRDVSIPTKEHADTCDLRVHEMADDSAQTSSAHCSFDSNKSSDRADSSSRRSRNDNCDLRVHEMADDSAQTSSAHCSFDSNKSSERADSSRRCRNNNCDSSVHEMADDSAQTSSAHCSFDSNKSSERADSSRRCINDNCDSSVHEMADDSAQTSSAHCRSNDTDDVTTVGKVVRTPSVRTQIRPEISSVESSLFGAVANANSSAHDDIPSPGVPTIESPSAGPSREPEPPRSTVKTQDRGDKNVLAMAMAMENDIDAVVDEAIRQFKREVEEATVPGENSVTLVNDKKQRTSVRRVKNNASYELAQQCEINENTLLRTGVMSSCAEDAETPSSPSSSSRRRVFNNASYELAQQSDYVKMLQKTARPFQRMDACDERPDAPRPGVNCGPRVVDIVRDTNPGTSSEKLVVAPKPEDIRKSSEADHQRDSMLDQIKKNSDGFSLRGEDGRMVGRLGSVDGNEDDEVDYPCLEVKSIVDYADIPVLEDARRRNESDEEIDREVSAERGLSFLGDFYPETKSHLARGSGTSEFIDERERSSEEYRSSRSDVTSDEARRNGREAAGNYASRELAFSASPTPPTSIDVNDPGAEGRNSAEPVAEPAVSALLVATDGVEGHANCVEGGKQKEKRRKEAACVETGEASHNATASSVHASTPATSSTPRCLITQSARCEDDKHEGKRVDETTREFNDNGAVGRRSENEEAKKRNESLDDCNEDGGERTNREMSATAAKRLAMASGTTRNNEHCASIVGNKHEVGQQKNVNERKKGGLGGFLQRFSRLRFSGRSKVPRSEVNRKFNESTSVNAGDKDNRRTNAAKPAGDQQINRARKEPDYIIIPLHGPEDERRDEDNNANGNKPRRSVELERSASCASPNGRPLVSSKPPLPPSHHPSGGSFGGGARQVGATSPTTRCAMSAAGVVVGNTRRRAATDLGSPAAIEMAKARAMQQAAQEPRPVGLLETDLDAAEPAIRHGNLSTIGGASATGHQPHNASSHVTTTSNNNQAGKKTRSLLNLNHTSARQGRELGNHLANENELRVPHSSANRNNSEHHQDHHNSVGNQRPHKSMEFLLDKENLHFVKPPENELQKVGERVPSEHELRVQRSLQRLNVPDWYKNSPAARDGFRLKRHSDASQHSGWRSLGSKTTSLSSLSSSSNRQPTTGVLLSPSPTPPVFSRWSTSLLNSAGSSPASSARSSFNHRQPYLGWRSQERLANPRTPAERLAQGILPQLHSTKKQQQQQTNQQLEVRNSIKEVTSAIVHYVQSGQEVAGGGGLSPRPRPDDWDDRGGARSTSPRGSVKLCWMESSFVGSRPVDSPETPMSLATDTECCAGCNATGTESCSCVDSATSGLYLDLTPTGDEPQQRQRPGQQQQQQQQHQQQQQQQYQQIQHHGSRSQCPSPSSTLNYHQQVHHHPHQQQQQQHRHHRGSGQSEDEEAMATAALLRNKPSPGSTTLEDVLDSLLGLPSASRTPSPGPGPISGSTLIRHHRSSNTGSPAGQTTNTNAGKSCSDLRQDLQESARVEDNVTSVVNEAGRSPSYYMGELVRRKSEGSDIVAPNRSSSRASSHVRNRRVSFDGGQQQQQQQQQQQSSIEVTGMGVPLGEKLIKCRNNKCNNATTLAEARRMYKSCHNCTCLYCSRECRRAHWQRHRRTCLHSRAGTLCRQVLSSAKEDPATLKHISALAQRGYATHGRGAVKCFFTSPEIAEQFVSNGFVDLGEPTYVKWSELLPSEMGAELYAEVMRLCKSYNPETRLVLYVAVCVVSEVPSSGAVRWERQLVSRCGKIRLDSSCRQATILASTSNVTSPRNTGNTSPCNITREMDSPETLVLTSTPGTDGQNTPRSSREIGFTNIQRQLRLRGVSLRRHFPQVYTKLCSYVDGSVDKFAPVTIYPRDQASGKSFMCIIMLDAEPERLQLLPTDSSRVRTVDISVEQE